MRVILAVKKKITFQKSKKATYLAIQEKQLMEKKNSIVIFFIKI
jgi:hypothetical protein